MFAVSTLCSFYYHSKGDLSIHLHLVRSSEANARCSDLLHVHTETHDKTLLMWVSARRELSPAPYTWSHPRTSDSSEVQSSLLPLSWSISPLTWGLLWVSALKRGWLCDKGGEKLWRDEKKGEEMQKKRVPPPPPKKKEKTPLISFFPMNTKRLWPQPLIIRLNY